MSTTTATSNFEKCFLTSALLCVNVFAAYPFYVLPIVFPNLIWLGLAQILFGMAGQLIVHGIVINRKMRRAGREHQRAV
jgi:hypothetical protein